MMELITEPKRKNKKTKRGDVHCEIKRTLTSAQRICTIKPSASRQKKNLPRKKRHVLVGVAINQLQNTLNQRHLFTHSM